MATVEAGHHPLTNGTAEQELMTETTTPPASCSDTDDMAADRQEKQSATKRADNETTGLRHLGQSRRMSSRQKELEKQLATGAEEHEDDDEETNAASVGRYSARQFVRCSSHDIVDHDSASSESSETQSVPTNVYEQKGIPLPRRMSESAGNRIRSATDRLIDQYAKDMVIAKEHAPDGTKPSQPVKHAREKFNTIGHSPRRRVSLDRERELEEVRSTIRRRTMTGEVVVGDDGDEVEARRRINSSSVSGDVKCRKSLSEIRSQWLSKAKEEKKRNSELNGGELTHERIGRIRSNLQQHANKTVSKTSHASVSPKAVNNARSFYKSIETRKEDRTLVSKPTIRRKNPEEIMARRRRATYGSEDDMLRARPAVDTALIDMEQVRSARDGYKKLESATQDLTPVNKPAAKVITQEDVVKTMRLHRERSESELVVESHNAHDGEEGERADVALSASKFTTEMETLCRDDAATEADEQCEIKRTEDENEPVVAAQDEGTDEDSVFNGNADQSHDAHRADEKADVIGPDENEDVILLDSDAVIVKQAGEINFPETNNNGPVLRAEICHVPTQDENNDSGDYPVEPTYL